MNIIKSLRTSSRAPLTYLLIGQLLLAVILVTVFGLTWSPTAAAGTSPILIIVNDSAPNPFGRYLAEILRAEGINTYNMIDLSLLTAPTITGYELVILAETPLTAGQATIITNYVNGGGRLIAMRPDSDIYSLFGINSASGTQNNGYLKISDTITLTAGSIPPGMGLTTETLQIHGGSTRYNNLSANAITLAQLYSNATNPTSYPAVVAGSGGQAVAFAYDLPRNIVYTRQGNPANANVDTDGDSIIRTIDLFQTTGGGDPWVDRDRIPIPQADEQQRFFARLVHHLVGFNMPLPQLWYFPEKAKTMLILTSDGHSNPDVWYGDLITAVESYDGNISVYLSIGNPPYNPNEEAYLDLIRSMGHEFGIHPPAYREDNYPPYDVDNLEEGYEAMQHWWNVTYQDVDFNPLPMARTIRNHQVAWLGWADIAETASITYNIGLDTSFYHYGDWLQKPDLSWPMGYITGSGQAMKFVKEDGSILDIFQLSTQLVDEHILGGAGVGWMGLTYTQSITISQDLIDSSLAGDYAALMTQFHVDYSSHGDGLEWANGTMAYAQANNVPIWSADQWLTFTETRYGTNFTNITWNGVTGVLNFDAEVEATPGMTLTLMVPATFKTRTLQSVLIDGVAAPFSLETIKGVSTAFVEIPDGTPLVTYDIVANYSSPTAITLQTFASQVGANLHTNAAATLFVLLGTITLVILLERRRRQHA